MSVTAVTWQRFLPNGITLGYIEFFERGRLYKTEYFKRDRSLPKDKQVVEVVSAVEYFKT